MGECIFLGGGNDKIGLVGGDSPHPPSKENPDGWIQLFHGYIVTLRRQFTFYHKIPKAPWYSFN